MSDCKRRCLALLYYDDDVSEIGQKRTLPQRSACMCVRACVSLCYQTALPHYYCVVIDVVLRCFPSVQVVDLLFSFLVTHLNIICMIWFSCNLSLSLSVWKLLLISTSSFFLVSKDQLSFVAALTSVALTSTLYFYLGVFILCCYSILTVDCLILLKYRNMHFITLNSF